MTAPPQPGPLLAHDVVAGSTAGDDVVVFAHGILGSRNNWRSFARRVVQECPSYRALLVDLRNHGQSHGYAPPHTVAAAGDDILALTNHLGLRPRAVVGHSWGGKVMLDLATRLATRGTTPGPGLALAVIVDAPPGIRTFGAQREEIDRVIAAIRAVPLPVSSRRALVDFLCAQGLSHAITQWMTTNLEPDPHATQGELRWKFNLDAIPEMLADFGARDLWPSLWSCARSTTPPRIVFVRGGLSDRWSPEEQQRLTTAVQAGIVADHVLPQAGHWVHTDDPEGLLALVVPLLQGRKV